VAVKLRLMRMGKKKQPTYRVVAADGRSPRDGRFIEILGTYEPRLEPSGIKIDNEKAVKWLSHFSALALSMSTPDGSCRGWYVPRISMNRPSRGERLSAATTR